MLPTIPRYPVPTFRQLPVWLLLATLASPAVPARAADLLKYVPNDSDLILSLDVKGLIDAPIVRKYAPLLAQRYGMNLMQLLAQDSPAAEKLLKENTAALQKLLKDRGQVVGFLESTQRTFRRIVVAGRLNGDDDEILLVFDCGLDAEQLAQLAGKLAEWSGTKLKIAKADEGNLIEVRVAGEEESWLLGAPEKGVLIATPSKAYAQEALAKAVGKKNAELSRDMRALLTKVEQEQTCWLAAIDTDENLQFRGGLRIGDDIRAELITTARDAEAARQQLDEMTSDLKDTAEYIGALALLAKELAPLVEVLRDVKPVQEGNEVQIKVVIEAKVLEAVLPEK
jgi:hypothetical protein